MPVVGGGCKEVVRWIQEQSDGSEELWVGLQGQDIISPEDARARAVPGVRAPKTHDRGRM